MKKDESLRTYITTLLNLTRTQKRLIAIVIDILILTVAFWLSFFMRLDSFSSVYNLNYWLLLAGVLPISLFCFVRLGLYRAVVRYMNTEAVWAVGLGCIVAATSMVVLSFVIKAGVPRSVPFIFLCLCLLSIGGTRIFMRSLVSNKRWHKKEAVLIYGAGPAGIQVQNVLSLGEEYYAAAFIDDREMRHGEVLQGIRVYPSSEIGEVILRCNIKKVLLAMPEASLSRRKQVLEEVERYSVKVLTIPNIADVVNGTAKIQEFKDVGIEDLLGREQVAPSIELLEANITDKVVMVTGAGGSIGSELCRQIVKLRPSRLVLFEISEFALYRIEKELTSFVSQHNLPISIEPIIGSVQQLISIESTMRAFKVNSVYHSAAYKHVPLVEYNVVEGIRNNVFGTYYTARAAMAAKVETFVLISTDKAVRPTNIMGVTKRLAELVLQALNKESNKTRFCMVRFGNVLGSSGSVVPLFRSQIKAGGPITLTHPEITRYFMTIPEASQLVIQAGAMGKGGDVFVLDMGEPIKIKDMAVQMVNLSGFKVKDAENPDGDIEIKCTGLRPGEKLFEELLVGDNVSQTEHMRILSANEAMLSWDKLEPILIDLEKACNSFDQETIRRILLSLPADFKPKDGICDLIWKESLESEVEKPKLRSIN